MLFPLLFSICYYTKELILQFKRQTEMYVSYTTCSYISWTQQTVSFSQSWLKTMCVVCNAFVTRVINLELKLIYAYPHKGEKTVRFHMWTLLFYIVLQRWKNTILNTRKAAFSNLYIIIIYKIMLVWNNNKIVCINIYIVWTSICLVDPLPE